MALPSIVVTLKDRCVEAHKSNARLSMYLLYSAGLFLSALIAERYITYGLCVFTITVAAVIYMGMSVLINCLASE